MIPGGTPNPPLRASAGSWRTNNKQEPLGLLAVRCLNLDYSNGNINDKMISIVHKK